MDEDRERTDERNKPDRYPSVYPCNGQTRLHRPTEALADSEDNSMREMDKLPGTTALYGMA